MKKSAIAFTILIVVTVGILFGLMEANIAIQHHQKVEVDDYPYAPFNIVHSQIKVVDTIGVWTHKWDVKAMDLNQEDIK